jgi:hypothetical protein
MLQTSSAAISAEDIPSSFSRGLKAAVYLSSVGSINTTLSSSSSLAKIENYVDGYGVGELSEYEFRRILTEVQEQLNVDINLG